MTFYEGECMTGRFFVAFLVASVLALFSASFVRAEDSKDVTLKGTLTCAKCDLKQSPTCQNVLQVKDGDKTTTYWLADNTLSKDSHGAVCHGPKEGVSVTGVVSEKDGKQWITASKIVGLPEKSKAAD